MQLTIELVPATCWYSNVRSHVSRQQWDIIRKQCYRQAGYRCEICRQTGLFQGFRHPVECHEIWDYDEEKMTQRLAGLICLCPLCHQVKHAGLTISQQGLQVILNRLMSVNNWTHDQAADHIEEEFEVWRVRSKSQWKLDISYLDSYIPVPAVPPKTPV